MSFMLCNIHIFLLDFQFILLQEKKMSQTSAFPQFGNRGQFRSDGKPSTSNKFNLEALFDFSNL